ncbi:hypothetical protein AHAS_Ahas17G0183500 [Arachis hypogaea]
MRREEVNVRELIAGNIQRVVTSTKDNTRLAFPSIIQRLCNEAGVETNDNEALLEEDRLITAKKIEKVVAVNPLQRARTHRANIQAPQHIPRPPQQEEPNVQMPSQKSLNWEQIQGSINQMQGDLNQLMEQQKHFNWDQMHGSLNQILEQQMVQQRNLAEFRALYEARRIQRRQYDVNTQAKLNYLFSTIATLKPNIPTFEQGIDALRV